MLALEYNLIASFLVLSLGIIIMLEDCGIWRSVYRATQRPEAPEPSLQTREYREFVSHTWIFSTYEIGHQHSSCRIEYEAGTSGFGSLMVRELFKQVRRYREELHV